MQVVPILKRFFELLGVSTMGVGLSIIISEHAKNSVCNSSGANIGIFGVSNPCMHIVWSYFGGFVLLALGLLVVIFGLLANRRSTKRRQKVMSASLASTWHWVDPRTGRGPAQYIARNPNVLTR